jgi:hypothetical protein
VPAATAPVVSAKRSSGRRVELGRSASGPAGLLAAVARVADAPARNSICGNLQAHSALAHMAERQPASACASLLVRASRERETLAQRGFWVLGKENSGSEAASLPSRGDLRQRRRCVLDPPSCCHGSACGPTDCRPTRGKRTGVIAYSALLQCRGAVSQRFRHVSSTQNTAATDARDPRVAARDAPHVENQCSPGGAIGVDSQQTATGRHL